jgi:imidazolonepropionase-like amidohydrolase
VRALLLIAMALLAPAPGQGDTLVIAPVNVVSMQDGSIRGRQAIVVDDGTITAIRDAGDLGDEAGANIDGQNAWVIPGLSEMHAHIPPQIRGEQYAQDVLTLFLANGISTVRGMLGEPWHLELREWLAAGRWTGPRLVTSGPSFNGNSVSSPGQAARRAREQQAAGYDFLKLHPGLEAEEFQAIADTANEIGIPFGGHVSFAVGLDTALASGQATIDHLDGYAEQLLPLGSPLHGVAPEWFGLNLAAGFDTARIPALAGSTALAGVWNVPTQSLFETTAGPLSVAELLARPGMEYIGPELRERWSAAVSRLQSAAGEQDRAAFLAARRALILALSEAGAGLLLGSDAPQIMNVPGFSTHQELEYLVQSGLTPLQALQSGTIAVARFFREPARGDVAPGMTADLILLRSNPLENISATQQIQGVLRDGVWYDRAALDRMLQEVAARGL